MERLDLPKGYGGWQAFDGTPQEISDCKSLHRRLFKLHIDC